MLLSLSMKNNFNSFSSEFMTLFSQFSSLSSALKDFSCLDFDQMVCVFCNKETAVVQKESQISQGSVFYVQ
jgi:hypothetical protein